MKKSFRNQVEISFFICQNTSHSELFTIFAESFHLKKKIHFRQVGQALEWDRSHLFMTRMKHHTYQFQEPTNNERIQITSYPAAAHLQA